MKDLNLPSVITVIFFIVLAIVMTIESNSRGQMIAELLDQRDFLAYRLEEAEASLRPCAIITEFVDPQWLAENLPTSPEQ